MKSPRINLDNSLFCLRTPSPHPPTYPPHPEYHRRRRRARISTSIVSSIRLLLYYTPQLPELLSRSCGCWLRKVNQGGWRRAQMIQKGKRWLCRGYDPHIKRVNILRRWFTVHIIACSHLYKGSLWERMKGELLRVNWILVNHSFFELFFKTTHTGESSV